MKRNTLKYLLFTSLLLSKLFVSAFLYISIGPGQLTPKEAGALFAVIAPMFVYLTTMFKDIVGDQFQASKSATSVEVKKVKWFHVCFYMVLIIGYAVGICFLILEKISGRFELTDAQLYLGGLESAFGLYLGVIVNALFKKEESKN